MTDIPVATPARVRTFSFSNRALLNSAALALVAGTAIWATGLALPASIAVLLGCCGIVWLLLSPRVHAANALLENPVNAGLLLFCVVMGFVVVVLGGEGHFVYTMDDWLTRDAVLADIVRHGWPVFYKIGGDAYYLRAPLGMYMIPGLVGHAFGLYAAHMALLTQNALLFATIFYLAASLSSGRILVYLLILYGGFDILPWLGRMFFDRIQNGEWAVPGVGVQWWARYFQYTDHFTQICFVPNHAIPGWFFAVLSIFAARRELDLATLGAVFAGLLFWSPLAPLAAVPVLLYLAWRDRREVFVSARTWLGVAVGACFVPVALFLVAGAGDIGQGSPVHNSGFWWIYFAFLVVELPHMVFLAALWPRVRDDIKPLLFISVAVLAVLPLYSFGPGNDLTMRGATAPLFLIAFAFSSVFLELKPEQKLARFLGGVIVIIGAAKAFISLAIAMLEPRYEISDCNVVTTSAQLNLRGLPTNYIHAPDRAPRWLVSTPGASESFETVGADWCWPDHPAFSSADKVPLRQEMRR